MIGLLPAAGNAERMGGLPKMLLPVPDGFLLEWHIRIMMEVGCAFVAIGSAEHNDDLLVTYSPRDGIVIEVTNYATMTETTLNMKQSIEQDESYGAYLLGLADTYFEDAQAYQKLANALNDGADLAVGLFYTRPEQRNKLGMCHLEGERITDVIDKPESTTLEWAWGVLGWQSTFWQYLRPEDPHIGYAIPRAIAAGLDVRAVKMDGQYFDCGSPSEYFECIRYLTEPEHEQA